MIVVIVFHPSFGAFVKSSHLATSNPTHAYKFCAAAANHLLFFSGRLFVCVRWCFDGLQVPNSLWNAT